MDAFALVSDAHQILVERSGRRGPGPPASTYEAALRSAINRWTDLSEDDRLAAAAIARRVLGLAVRVEAGAGDAEFTPTEVAEILALLHAAQRRSDGERGVLYRRDDAPSSRLAKLLREAVQDLPVPKDCTGYWDEYALLEHDGDTCPVHEIDSEAAAD